MRAGFSRLALHAALPVAIEHLKYALLNPRSCPCSFASEGFIILRDVARRCVVISQVIH
jgi:hypothetical protein